MKLSEFLKILGLKTNGDEKDPEIEGIEQDEKKDITNSQALDKNGISINIYGDKGNNDKDTQNNNVENREDKDKEQEEYMADLSKIKFENGKFTGLKTLTEKDTELKALLESVNAYTDAQTAQAAIDSAIKSELDKYDITQGISESVVLASLNKDNIKYLDNKVLGVEEAFAGLAKDNTGMLKIKAADGSNNKETETAGKAEGPALEGFSKDMNSANPLSDTDLVNFAFGSD